METEPMGRVLTSAIVENVHDLYEAHHGQRSPDAVRRVEIAEALVDTGATLLALPKTYIEQLGLDPLFSRRVMTSSRPTETAFYGPVRLTIQGRFCNTDVMEVPPGVPPLIGQIPLENLDFVVDPRGQRLIGNPAHGGEHMFELY